MVLAELPRRMTPDYMYFSTRHQARLLGGYSGFVPWEPQVWEAFDAFPTPAGIAASAGWAPPTSPITAVSSAANDRARE